MAIKLDDFEVKTLDERAIMYRNVRDISHDPSMDSVVFYDVDNEVIGFIPLRNISSVGKVVK